MLLPWSTIATSLPPASALDHARIMEIARPYLGTMVGEYSDWTPLEGRNVLFPEEVDSSDPWQFKNFRVS